MLVTPSFLDQFLTGQSVWSWISWSSLVTSPNIFCWGQQITRQLSMVTSPNTLSGNYTQGRSGRWCSISHPITPLAAIAVSSHMFAQISIGYGVFWDGLWQGHHIDSQDMEWGKTIHVHFKPLALTNDYPLILVPLISININPYPLIYTNIH